MKNLLPLFLCFGLVSLTATISLAQTSVEDTNGKVPKFYAKEVNVEQKLLKRSLLSTTEKFHNSKLCI